MKKKPVVYKPRSQLAVNLVHELAKAMGVPDAGNDVFRDLDCLEGRFLTDQARERLAAMILE